MNKKKLTRKRKYEIMKPDLGYRIVILNRDDDAKKTAEVILEGHSKLLMKISSKLLSSMKVKL